MRFFVQNVSACGVKRKRFFVYRWKLLAKPVQGKCEICTITEETLYYINYDAIVKNAIFFKKRIGNSKLCAVVKNNAYGHGLLRTVGVLADIADCFAVGSVEEALVVKQVAKNVLVLLPQDAENAGKALSADVALTVDSFRSLDVLQKAVPLGKKASVHLKIQTGMHRLGFDLCQLDELKKRLDLSKVRVDGVFSHFYGESTKDCDIQYADFLQATKMLQSFLPQPFTRHIANTSATLLGGYNADMVRVGLGLYGYGCDGLVPVKTVTAKVIALRNCKSGDKVSYGGYTLQKDCTLAVVNCGYANGFPRALKNAVVRINGQNCPVVGKICMAMCMADVTGVEVDVGDSAVLLGKGVNNANCDVIIYELLCNLR